MPDTILILEDSRSRLAALREAIDNLGPTFNVRVWSDASRMIAEMGHYLPDTKLFSLDWHLKPVSSANPGTGYDVVKALCKIKPVAPVIVHSSAILESVIMRDNLLAASWMAEQIPLPVNEQVRVAWLPKVRQLLSLS
jgi:hypothetical protein